MHDLDLVVMVGVKNALMVVMCGWNHRDRMHMGSPGMTMVVFPIVFVTQRFVQVQAISANQPDCV